MQSPKIAIVILNWNGKDFLKKFLPSVIQHSPQGTVYVADNASTDDSVQLLKNDFPQVKLVINDANGGFAKGYNDALKKIDAEFYVLLNSDVEVTPGWTNPVVELMMSDLSIAACQPKILAYYNKNQFEYAGSCGGFIDKFGYPFCRGRIFDTLETDTGQYNSAKEVFWATGACMFVRASVFHEFGGFDEDYFAHMEEIDLCWRMKNRGYKIYAEPASTVYHVGGGTLNKTSPKKSFLNFRNNLITFTKNYSGSYLFITVLFRLKLDGIAAFKFLLSGEPAHLLAVLKAHFAYYGSLGKTIRKRKQLKSHLNYRPSKSGILKKSIVAQYYIKGKKNYSEIDNFF